MAVKIFACSDLTGGGIGALDAINGSLLDDGDAAMVKQEYNIYWYHLDATVGGSESSPWVITPDSNAGTKRWIFLTTTGMIRVGRDSVANLATTHTVTFTDDMPTTNYTVQATLENTTDTPPSQYSLIVSGKTVNGFTVTFSGAMDSANYELGWRVELDIT
jgi:hypothetical protein